MKIELSQIERNICCLSGFEGHISGNLLEISPLMAGMVAFRIEQTIAAQETDHGNRLVAQEWSKAKSGLIDKLRNTVTRD